MRKGKTLNDHAWRRRYEQWVDRFGAELYRTCLRRVGGRRPLAEELLNEAWLVAWKKRDTFRGSDNDARRWLHKIAYNLAPAVWRRNRTQETLSDETLERTPDAPWSASEEDDPLERARLYHCFSARALLEQDILRMRFGFRPDPEVPDTPVMLSWAEIAAQLATIHGHKYAADQVRMRAKRALMKLRQCLQGQEEPAGPASEGTSKQLSRVGRGSPS